MVSVREIKRIAKEQTDRGIKSDALQEIQSRGEQLMSYLVKLAGIEASKRGNESTRISSADVRLAFLRIKDEVNDDE